MTKRENLVRAALLLLVLGTIATLLVLDRSRGNDRPDAEPTPSASPTSSRSPTGTVVPLPTNEPGKGETYVIPTPPPGI